MKYDFACLFPTLLTTLCVFITPWSDASASDLSKVPDSEFLEFAKNVVPLISDYTPESASDRFQAFREHLDEAKVEEFNDDMMRSELRVIKEVQRVQKFTINQLATSIRRFDSLGYVIVTIVGSREKSVGTRNMPSEEITYYLKLGVRPQDESPNYKITVLDLRRRGEGPTKSPIERAKDEREEIFDILLRTTKDLKSHKVRVTEIFETFVEKFEKLAETVDDLASYIVEQKRELDDVKRKLKKLTDKQGGV